jgi:hypothetical protein
MNWKDYEKEIFETFQSEYPDAEINLDAKIEGRFSKQKRQIDILIEQYVAGNRLRIAIDAKYFNKKIDVKVVENYISMLSDIEAHKGLLITNVGYSKAAINRAYYDPTDIELDILNFSELKEFQSEVALPFAGNNAVTLFAPFGWIIDTRTYKGNWLASLYQRGVEFDTNMDEWIYVSFWDRTRNNDKISDVLEIQKKEFKDGKFDVEIDYLNTIKRNDADVVLRKVKYKKHPVPEYTGFVEFDTFIFYAVMFSPTELSNKNIRKLENILMTIKPMKVKYE